MTHAHPHPTLHRFVYLYPMTGKRILICPLDWGLGHASRCIPIIRNLIAAGHEVIIGADKGPASLLKLEFPQLIHLNFPGLEIKYPEDGNFAVYMLQTAPKLIRQIALEQEWTQKTIEKYAIDIVISDNRYGARSTKAHSIFITHQLFIKGTPSTRFLEPLIRFLTWNHIRKFDACWVPDFPNEPSLGATLSHGNKLPLPNTRYLGNLSRFDGLTEKEPPFRIPDYLALLSGPEPQRTMLENLLLSQRQDHKLDLMIVQGQPWKKSASEIPGVLTHLSPGELLYCLKRIKALVARSGYSTMMDIQYSGTKALLIPTPGQTEQVYLASHYQNLGWYATAEQQNLRLETDLPKTEQTHPPQLTGADGLTRALAELG